MTRKSCLVGLPALLALVASDGNAQSPSPQCSQLFTADACQKSVDLFLYLAPQLGTVIAGGSPVMGQGQVLSFIGSGRSIPGISVGLRVNILNASIPDLTNVPFSLVGTSNSTAIPVADRMVFGPTIDAAVGLFRGIPLATTDILGVDLLLSALYLPDIDESDVHVRTEGSGLKFGWGARLGLLQETILTPAVTVSFLRRQLPTVNVTSSTQGANDVDLTISRLRKTTDSWRAIASKSFVGFAVAVGGGVDNYDSGATVAANVNGTATGPFTLSQQVTRTNFFADVTIQLGKFRLSGELGRVQGGDIHTYNEFSGPKPDAARIYGSLGARMTF